MVSSLPSAKGSSLGLLSLGLPHWVEGLLVRQMGATLLPKKSIDKVLGSRATRVLGKYSEPMVQGEMF